MKKTLFAVVMLTLCGATSSDAALVVAACGTTPVTYTAGQVRQITVDTNGRVCT